MTGMNVLGRFGIEHTKITVQRSRVGEDYWSNVDVMDVYRKVTEDELRDYIDRFFDQIKTSTEFEARIVVDFSTSDYVHVHRSYLERDMIHKSRWQGYTDQFPEPASESVQCNHTFEEKVLFTSSYKKCTKCGEER